jgi:hypothetical protein
MRKKNAVRARRIAGNAAPDPNAWLNVAAAPSARVRCVWGGGGLGCVCVWGGGREREGGREGGQVWGGGRPDRA